eukprot:282113-Rhodomonas_salina.1
MPRCSTYRLTWRQYGTKTRNLKSVPQHATRVHLRPIRCLSYLIAAGRGCAAAWYPGRRRDLTRRIPHHAAFAAIFGALCESGLARTACRAARAAERVIAQRWRTGGALVELRIGSGRIGEGIGEH